LTNVHNAELPELWRLLNYYEGRQPLSYMHPELLATLDDRLRQMVVNWARLVVEAVEERIDLTSFRLGGKPEADKQLARVFQYNDLDAGYQQAHVTAMVMKRVYAIVGANPVMADRKYPWVTIESPLEVHAELDPATREVVAAIKRWWDTALDGRSATSPRSTCRTARLRSSRMAGRWWRSTGTTTSWARCRWCRS